MYTYFKGIDRIILHHIYKDKFPIVFFGNVMNMSSKFKNNNFEYCISPNMYCKKELRCEIYINDKRFMPIAFGNVSNNFKKLEINLNLN
jgi:hypothetical protein